MKGFLDWMNQATGMSYEDEIRLFVSLGLMAAAWFLSRIFSRIVVRRVEDYQSRYRMKKAATYLVYFLSLLILARIWFEGFQSFTTLLGIFSAGLAIALKDPISNMAAWLFIILRRPLEVGDRIELAAISGDVIDIRVFEFTLLEINNWVGADQSTGRIVHIPNNKIFTESLANYSKGFQYIWNEIRVVVTFESDWRKAKRLLEEIAVRNTHHLTKEAERRVKEASRKFMIFYSHLTPIVYTDVAENGIVLTVRHLCRPRNRRNMTQVLWEDILKVFEAHEDLELAYPTYRMYRPEPGGRKTERNGEDPL